MSSLPFHSAMEKSQLANMRKSLLDEGFVDEQFVELEAMQDDSNPNFIEEMVMMFYNDAADLIQTIEQALEKTPLDFYKLDGCGHSFQGCCSSVGAKRVLNAYVQLKECRRAENEGGCRSAFQQLKEEFATLKEKLNAYFQLGKQIRAGEGTSGTSK